MKININGKLVDIELSNIINDLEFFDWELDTFLNEYLHDPISENLCIWYHTNFIQ